MQEETRKAELCAPNELKNYTVYFRYVFAPEQVGDSVLGDVHYGHRVVQAENLAAAINLVMAEEKASMAGHVGEGRGLVQWMYATNNVDPAKGVSEHMTCDTNKAWAGSNIPGAVGNLGLKVWSLAASVAAKQPDPADTLEQLVAVAELAWRNAGFVYGQIGWMVQKLRTLDTDVLAEQFARCTGALATVESQLIVARQWLAELEAPKKAEKLEGANQEAQS